MLQKIRTFAGEFGKSISKEAFLIVVNERKMQGNALIYSVLLYQQRKRFVSFGLSGFGEDS